MASRAAAQLGVLPGHRRAEHPRQRPKPITEAGRNRAGCRPRPLATARGTQRSVAVGRWPRRLQRGTRGHRFRRHLTPTIGARATLAARQSGGREVGTGMGLVSRISAAAVAVLGTSLLVACGGSVADADSDGARVGTRPARRPARSAPPPGPTRRPSGRSTRWPAGGPPGELDRHVGRGAADRRRDDARRPRRHPDRSWERTVQAVNLQLDVLVAERRRTPARSPATRTSSPGSARRR
jgi:hypothetical protein